MWDLEANGYRKSYGIVTAMFGITIVACYVFKMILSKLNQKLERGELEWDARDDVANQTAEMEGTTVDEALSMRVSYAPSIVVLLIFTMLIRHIEGFPLFGVVEARIFPKSKKDKKALRGLSDQQPGINHFLNSWM